MSNLRIIELEQQLKRRDERLNEIEAKVNQLTKYTSVACLEDYTMDSYYGVEVPDKYGELYKIEDVLECFK